MPVADFHDIAPDGEVDLILQNPEQLVTHVNSIFEDIRPPSRLNFTRSHEQIAPCMAAKAQKAITDVWEPDSWVCEEEPSEEKSMREELESDTKVKEALAVSKKNTNSNANKTYVRIRVSLKHLTLASSYFERNFKSGMSESHILSSEGRLDFRMNEENPKAMLTVMNVIHGRSRQVPRRISLDMLTKIAVLVDYLECHEAIEPFSDMWIDNLKGAIATNYSKVLIQWLCISLVFHKKSQFTAMTCIAIRQAKGPVQTLGLPIRKGIVEKINRHRYYALDRLFSALEDVLEDFRQDRACCTFECNAMRYGVLAKELGCRALLFPRPQIPFLGYSFENTAASVRNIQDLRYFDYSKAFCQHTCQLRSYIAPIISNIDHNLKGLSLSDFV